MSIDLYMLSDFSEYNKLTLYIMATSGAAPTSMRLQLSDQYTFWQIPYHDINISATGSFVKYEIPLTSFTAPLRGTGDGGSVLDQTTINQLNFVYEHDYVGSVKDAIIYIDKIQFEK